MTLPATWAEAFGGRPGTVRLTRRFGRPTGLEGDERVWLEVVAAGEAGVLLAGAQLGTTAGAAVRFDLTGRLEFRNRLDLDLVAPTDAAASVAEVRLLIVRPLGPAP